MTKAAIMREKCCHMVLHGGRPLPDDVVYALDEVEAERDALEAEVERLRETLQFVDDKISYEINPSNYDHQEVCSMNADWCEIGTAVSVALAQEGE